MSTAKRKRNIIDDSDDRPASPPTAFLTPPRTVPKRRRLDSLEHTFSHLNIYNPITPTRANNLVPVSSPTSPNNVQGSSTASLSSAATATLDSNTVMSHAADGTDEPADIKMKGTSWYEPEKDRIVVTDLDSSDEEDTEHIEGNIEISSTLLARLKAHRNDPVPLSKVESQALVLFRPLVRPTPSDMPRESSPERHTTETLSEFAPPDDAMDLDL